MVSPKARSTSAVRESRSRRGCRRWRTSKTSTVFELTEQLVSSVASAWASIAEIFDASEPALVNKCARLRRPGPT
jgi:hypothetical protein